MMVRKNYYFFIYLILLSLFISSCATPTFRQSSKYMRKHIRKGNYKKALKVLRKDPSYKEKKSKLLYYMERGLIYHYDKKYRLSSKLLTKAKDLHQKFYTISLEKKLQTLITNETSDNFYGEVYERSMIHFYLALNHFLLYQRGFEFIPKKKGKPLKKRQFNENEKNVKLRSAAAEVRAWDSFLDSQQESRRGKSVFKNDMLAKTFGAFIHEIIGGHNEQQTALQLYKDAKVLLYKNYNSYKTFNKKFKKFKSDFSKLPELSKNNNFEDTYIKKTKFSKQLISFLNFKILSLTKKVRPNDFENTIKTYNIGQETVDKVNSSKRPSNVAILIQKGMIPIKKAVKQHYSLEKALTPDNPTEDQRKIAKIGSFVLLGFAANELGLFPPSNRYDPFGAEIGIRLVDYSTSGLAISFELPKIANKKIRKTLTVEIYNQNNELVWDGPLPIIAPLGDIAEEAVAEYSAALYPKLGARLATKHFMAILATYLTYTELSRNEDYKYWAKIAAIAEYALLSQAIGATEIADVRYWSTLPSDIRIANLYLDKGVYTIKAILSRPKSGSIIKNEYPLGTFEIKDENKKKIFNFKLIPGKKNKLN